MSFEKFGLSPELMSGLADVRMNEPTPLQNEVIPPALQGKHMLVKHGAGDDGVFLIPALHKLTKNGEVSGTRVLILTPSIERAKVIDEAVWAMGYHAQISSASLSMKGNREEQEQALNSGAPVIVANPGRLIELLEKNKQKFSDLDLIVIDEAQEMENFNLVNRVKDILQNVENDPQVLVLCSELNNAAKQLSGFLLKEPEVVGFENYTKETNGIEQEDKPETEAYASSEDEKQKEFVLDQEEVNRKLEQASVSVVLNPEEKTKEEEPSAKEEELPEPDPIPKDLTQAYIYVPPRAKISTLLAHLEKTLTKNIVVFAASKRTTDRLFRIIRKKDWGVVSVDDKIDEQTYNERFGKFTSGEMKILLVGGMSATDVELNEVKQVINYDVPNEVEEYKYRAELVGNGKAARMVSLVSKMDKEDIDVIVKQVGYAPTEIPLPEEVKEKKKGKSKGKKNNKSRSNGNNKENKKNDKRRKKTKQERSNGLPRPTYDGLSGGREGKKKRPEPSEDKGAFGWIKKLFN